MDIQKAESIAGKLTKTSKMPGYSYGLPAIYCKTGSKLREIEDSPCYGCYAMKGFYHMPVVKAAMERRINGIKNPSWVRAMVTLIKKKCAKVPFFRWHDSGDIQDLNHFRKIIKIAEILPHIKFWIPTQEHELIRKIKPENIPANLTIRLSNRKIGEQIEPQDFPSSGVVKMDNTDWEEAVANNTKRYFACPSSLQNNECNTCRACWNPDIEHIIYRMH